MGDHGHPHAQFRRALQRGSLTVVLSAAANLDHIDLKDALAICGLVARKEPAEFDRFAVRFIAAAIDDRRTVDLPYLLSAIAVLERLRRDGNAGAAERALGL